MRKTICLSLAFIAIIASPALAQDVVYVDQPTSVADIIVAAALALLPIISAVAVAIIRKHYGDANAKLAEDVINALQTRLQGAVGRASGLAINSLGTRALTEVIHPSDPAVKAGVDYLRETMGDTLKKLGLDTTKGQRLLAEMVVAQIGEKTAPALAGVPLPPETKVADGKAVR